MALPEEPRNGHDGEMRGSEQHFGVLDETTCFRLLSRERFGRVAFSSQGLPSIFPVNYVLEGDTAYFRTEPGEKLTAAQKGAVACLEVDGHDGSGLRGWSVMATGRLRVASWMRVGSLSRLPAAPWAWSPHDHFVELSVELITGRTVGDRDLGPNPSVR